MRIFPKVLGFMAMVVIATVAGVSAMFNYYDPPESVLAENNLLLAQFEYKPEEVLPDMPEDTAKHSNHLAVIYELLFNSKMGLNRKSGVIANQVESKGILPYLEKITQGNLKHLIDVSEGGQNLGFTLEYINESSFYAYTYYRLGHADGATIVVYRTLMEENNDPSVDEDGNGKKDNWKASGSVQGWAKAQYYDHKDNDDGSYRIDISTWTNYEGVISV